MALQSLSLRCEMQGGRILMSEVDHSQVELERVLKRHSELTWLAAFIDSEGAILVHRPYRVGNYRGSYHITVQIDNTFKPLLLYAKAILGSGKIGVKRCANRNLRWKTVWRIWIRKKQDVTRILSELYPYLRAKRRQARIALRLLRLYPLGVGARAGDERADRLYRELKRLNRRGALNSGKKRGGLRK
jgi:hypothetical protein